MSDDVFDPARRGPASIEIEESAAAGREDEDAPPPFLRDGGLCGARIAAIDWGATPLGPLPLWPASLRAAVSLMLRAPVPMVLLWGEGGILLHNDAYIGFAGDRDAAPLGRPLRDAWPEARGFVDEVLATGLAGGTLRLRDQERVLIRNGRPVPVWLDLDFSPVPDETGAPVGVLGILTETTERVTASRRTAFLLALSDALRGLATPAEIMALTAERVGAWLNASRVFYAEIAEGVMTVESDHARGVDSIVGVHSLTSFGPDLLRAYEAGRPVVVQDVGGDPRLSAEARAGLTARQVGAFVDVVLFQEARWVGLLAVQNAGPRLWTPAEESLIQEVGERVKVAVERARAEQRLREMKDTLEQQVIARTAELRRFHEIVEATAAPICAFDTDYRLIAFNRAHNAEFERVHGFETRIGDVFPDLFADTQRAQMRALMARALAGEAFTAVARFGRADQDMPLWEISYTPLRDEAGAVIGAFHQASDITDRMAAQAELEAAQEALRQSQKMEAMGQLTGGVAHDFNNLLTPIIGSLDMLVRKDLGGARERRLIDAALQSAERAKTLVQRLLAFARRQPLQPTAVDVGRLIDNLAALLRSTLGPTIQLRMVLGADLPPAMADAHQLEMALLNLAVNARDAMPQGGMLTIAAHRETVAAGAAAPVPAGRYLRVEVADTGAGMDEATRRRAVEPFFSTKGVGQGTGLGLSMVHGLMAQLGGALTISSAPGTGTRIALWLPISPTAAADEPRRAADVTSGAARGTALLVDDEPLVRMSTADMLLDLGYQVIEAESADAALRMIREGLAPDLLLTDHLMPGMSGAELARTLRAERPALPVLIISGYAEADGIEADLPRLTKPFRNADLAASLAAL
ncbi:PAS domain-containing protein [Sphingomonas morindae]|uniref:histidine kinase n=1 Tax=Sphingomonas morindae TaxID=1541170 RepID=A0ABY4XCV1_9SPHN|nr:PAS domain-containing protein [Sphingomonas morindae]USI74730.1 PAS domain-containing protein [Sphingomonas morindae]